MTRRGSLIYYLTAWICGCFFMSLAIWTRDLWNAETGPSSRSHEAFGVLFFYFYGLVFGGLAVLIGAFLLRRIMALLKCKTPSHWALVGAILAPGVVAILGLWGRHAGMDEQGATRAIRIITYGPKLVVDTGWWLAIPAGAVTAYLLCRVQRAFAPQQSPQAS